MYSYYEYQGCLILSDGRNSSEYNLELIKNLGITDEPINYGEDIEYYLKYFYGYNIKVDKLSTEELIKLIKSNLPIYVSFHYFPYVKKERERDGEICIGCNNFIPMAPMVENFKCYSCRS